MKQLKRSILTFLLILTVLAFGVSADEAYSSQNDPLVSLSYVNDVLGPQIMEQIMNKVEKEYVKLTDISAISSGMYSTVTLVKDQTLTVRSVCEIVFLSGSATVLVTSSDNVRNGMGIHDLTDAKILTNGSIYPLNHYTIVTKPDGRGFYVTSDSATVLIRGEYDITE